jgi:hypothetical protein
MVMEENFKKAFSIYHTHLRRGMVDIESAVSLGMIPKNQLINGVRYIGYCRNATNAVWNAEMQRFIYIREKFGCKFEEEIVHPEDDIQFDVFVPVDKHGIC